MASAADSSLPFGVLSLSGVSSVEPLSGVPPSLPKLPRPDIFPPPKPFPPGIRPPPKPPLEALSMVICVCVSPTISVQVSPIFKSGVLTRMDEKLHGTVSEMSSFPLASLTVTVVPAGAEVFSIRKPWVEDESKLSAMPLLPQARTVPPVMTHLPPLSLP